MENGAKSHEHSRRVEEVSAEVGKTALLPSQLTKRELEVLAIVAQGKTNEQAAKILGVTVHAIKFHLASVYSKLNVPNRTAAAMMWVLNPPDSPENGN